MTAKLVLITFMAPGLMMASNIACTLSVVCTYSITGIGLNTSSAPTEDAGITWSLTFTFLGPEMYDAAPNSLFSYSDGRSRTCNCRATSSGRRHVLVDRKKAAAARELPADQKSISSRG